MKILYIFLQITTFLCMSTCINLECDYISHSSTDYPPLGSVYTCKLRNVLNIISPELTIDSISTTHSSGKSHNDVQGIYDQNGGKNIQYFPRGLDKFFKNIKFIDINHGRIKEIHQNDLKVFPKLEALDLYDNDIQVIEAGTFDFNPNLKVIWLTSKILHIESNVFAKLNNLSYLYLQKNPCINKDATNSLSEVKSLAVEAYTKCKDSVYSRLNDKLVSLESEPASHKFSSSYKQKVTDLENEIKSSKFSYLSSFKKRINIDNLTVNNRFVEDSLVLMVNELSANITTQLKNSQSTVYDMKIEIADLNRKIDNLDNLVRKLVDEIQTSGTSRVRTTTSKGYFMRDDDDFLGERIDEDDVSF